MAPNDSTFTHHGEAVALPIHNNHCPPPPLKSAFLHRNLHIDPLIVRQASGCHITLEDGRCIIDATSGAAVSCLGHSNEKVKQAMMAQLDQVAYCLTLMLGTNASEELAREVIAGTGGLMEKL